MTRLGRARWLFVIARGTAFSFRDTGSCDPKEVARSLGVRYVLQGCIQSAGKRLRLNAALIDGVEGGEIWADYFDRSLDYIFAVQDEITDVIIGRVHSEVQLAERQRALLTPMTNLDAWSAYHRGCWHMDRHTPGDYERAEELFKVAGQLDPRQRACLPHSPACIASGHFSSYAPTGKVRSGGQRNSPNIASP
jgi:hypothetical protein